MVACSSNKHAPKTFPQLEQNPAARCFCSRKSVPGRADVPVFVLWIGGLKLGDGFPFTTTNQHET